MSPIEELLLESNWKRTRTPIIVLASFIVSFVGTRAYTLLYPGSQFSLGGFHIHHINYGILSLAVSGGLSVYFMGPRIAEVSSLFLGVGLALVVDEFWLLVTENFGFQNYWGLDLHVATFVATVLAALLALLLFWREHSSKEEDIKEIISPASPIEAAFQSRGRLSRLASALGFRPPRKKLPAVDYALIVVGVSSDFHREGGMLIVDATAASIVDITPRWKRWKSARAGGTAQEFVETQLR